MPLHQRRQLGVADVSGKFKEHGGFIASTGSALASTSGACVPSALRTKASLPFCCNWRSTSFMAATSVHQ